MKFENVFQSIMNKFYFKKQTPNLHIIDPNLLNINNDLPNRNIEINSNSQSLNSRSQNLIKTYYKFNLLFFLIFLVSFLILIKNILPLYNQEKNSQSFENNKGRHLLSEKANDNNLFSEIKISDFNSELELSTSKKFNNLIKQEFANKIINKEFKGTWSSTSQLANFKYEIGMITGHVSNSYKYSVKGFEEEVLLFNLNICDDKYVDRWWHALLGHLLIDNKQKSSVEISNSKDLQESMLNKEETLINIQENSLSSEKFSTILNYGEFLHHSEDQICKLMI
jgi:hypothetical protein